MLMFCFQSWRSTGAPVASVVCLGFLQKGAASELSMM
jgi:hypothetical protein